jgi:hypothetical protein
VIAATLIGWALQRFAHLRDAAILGLIAGMVIAQFVPVKGSCGLPRRES